MIVKKPRNVDFNAIIISMQKQVDAIKLLHNKALENKLRLEKIENRNSKNERALSYATLDLEMFAADLKIKTAVYEEFMERTAMQLTIDKREKDDYQANNKMINIAANKLVNDFGVSEALRKHLGEVLKVNSSNFTEDQHIAWYLALKKEVELCKNYKKK